MAVLHWHSSIKLEWGWEVPESWAWDMDMDMDTHAPPHSIHNVEREWVDQAWLCYTGTPQSRSHGVGKLGMGHGHGHGHARTAAFDPIHNVKREWVDHVVQHQPLRAGEPDRAERGRQQQPCCRR